jgi:flagellar hook protein FlgE
MGLFGALFTGVSGLNAQSEALGIISNNIANVNTTGYKASNSSFSDLVTQTSAAEEYDPGGVRSNVSQNITQQGELTQTSSATDLAISGDGMFVVTANAADYSANAPVYTRAGSFTTDASGDLVNTAGYYLMGWKLTSSGDLPAGSDTTSSLTPINVNAVSSVLQQTGNITLDVNVDSTDVASGGTPGVYNSSVTPNFSHQVSVIDSLGTSQSLTYSSTKNYPDAWTTTVTGGGSNYPYTFGVLYSTSGNIQAAGAVTSAAVGSPTTAATSGTASDTFSSSISGNVLTVTEVNDNGTTHAITTHTAYTYGSGVLDPSTSPVNITLPAMNFNDGSSTAQTVSLDITNSTQYDSADNVNSVTSDGVAFGTRTGISIDSQGYVSASYSNGEVEKIYQIPVATFNSYDSLQETTGDVYSQTSGSGSYVLRAANTGSAGTIDSSTLEDSNVDIADEFSKMIITQQAYSANTKVITTADQMLSTLLQIQTG